MTQETTDLRRPLRFMRAWLCYQMVMWLPWWRARRHGPLDRLHFWLLPWAGDWAYQSDTREMGLDPWGDRSKWSNVSA